MSLDTRIKRPSTRKGRAKYDEASRTTRQKKKDAERELIAGMVRSKMKDDKIAEKLGISESALIKRRQRHGIKRSEIGRPEKPERRTPLDTSKIKDKETRKEIEWKIASLKRRIKDRKEERGRESKIHGKDDRGVEIYAKQFDVYIKKAERALYELENPTIETHKILMRGYEKRGRKPGAYTEAEKYNMQCDRALKTSMGFSWGKYKKWKADHLLFRGIREYYDYMFNEYLPSVDKVCAWNYRPEKVAVDAKDSPYDTYDYA